MWPPSGNAVPIFLIISIQDCLGRCFFVVVCFYLILLDFKGIVSRDFRCLQMILKDRAWVPGIPLDVIFF